MTLRTGVDLLHLPRFERVLERRHRKLLDRVFTDREQALCAGRVRSLAGRFALKEAAAKALGTGLWRQGVSWKDIEILRQEETGEPRLRLAGGAAERARLLDLREWSVSLSHDGEYVLAMVAAI